MTAAAASWQNSPHLHRKTEPLPVQTPQAAPEGLLTRPEEQCVLAPHRPPLFLLEPVDNCPSQAWEGNRNAMFIVDQFSIGTFHHACGIGL